jgi:outer membrane PBP1 activator LpoA protein
MISLTTKELANMKNSIVKPLLIITAAIAFTGCASTSELDAVRADAAKAQQTANEAMTKATQAQASADAANAKLDRVFKKASQK